MNMPFQNKNLNCFFDSLLHHKLSVKYYDVFIRDYLKHCYCFDSFFSIQRAKKLSLNYFRRSNEKLSQHK